MVGEGTYFLFKERSTLFVAMEEIEAGTAGGEQHGVTLTGNTVAGIYGLIKRMGVIYLTYFTGKEVQEFGIVHTHTDYGLYLFGDQRGYLGIVVTLVFATEYKYGIGVCHTLKGIPRGVDIGSLGVVDIAHSVYVARKFKSMLYAGEIAE